jgi:uncharacterized membrane protein YdjX (TVP38/TMEM64 family)
MAADPLAPPQVSLRRPVIVAGFVAALAVSAIWLPLEDIARRVNPLAAVALGALLLCVLVPRTAISLLCGALFGAWAGAGWALAAALLAALVTRAVGRWAGHDLLARRSGDRLRRLDRWLARHGLLAVVVVRLLPLAPFGFVGYAYGGSSVQFRHYFLGTAIGATPSAISYATIGAAAVAPESLTWLTFLPALIGVAVSTGAALYWRYR